MLRLGFSPLVLGLLVFLGGCGIPQTNGVLTEKNNGMTVTLKPGDTLVVQLKGNPSTGYTWEPENKDSKTLNLTGEPEFTSQNNAIGSGGVFTLRFKAVAAGKEPLKLIYHRSFEKDVAPVQTFEVSIVVK